MERICDSLNRVCGGASLSMYVHVPMSGVDACASVKDIVRSRQLALVLKITERQSSGNRLASFTPTSHSIHHACH